MGLGIFFWKGRYLSGSLFKKQAENLLDSPNFARFQIFPEVFACTNAVEMRRALQRRAAFLPAPTRWSVFLKTAKHVQKSVLRSPSVSSHPMDNGGLSSAPWLPSGGVLLGVVRVQCPQESSHTFVKCLVGTVQLSTQPRPRHLLQKQQSLKV